MKAPTPTRAPRSAPNPRVAPARVDDVDAKPSAPPAPNLFWSPRERGFYDDTIHAKDRIPEDAVPITQELRAKLLAATSKGHEIVTGDDGSPISRPPKEPELAEVVEAATNQVRAARAGMLSRLDGLQASALANGDMQAAKEIEGVKQALRDITKTVDASTLNRGNAEATFKGALFSIANKADAAIKRAMGHSA